MSLKNTQGGGGGGGGDVTQHTVASKTANYGVNLSSDDVIFCDTTGGAFTVTLPASHTAGETIHIVDNGFVAATNNITIATADSDKINNSSADYVISTSGTSITLISDGTNWNIL
jgi:hypothetical protein